LLYAKSRFKICLHPLLRICNIRNKKFQQINQKFRTQNEILQWACVFSKFQMQPWHALSVMVHLNFCTRFYGLQNINSYSSHFSDPPVGRAVRRVNTSESTCGWLSESKSVSRLAWYVTKAFTAIMTPG
jgi:hypothetical protein